MCVVFLCYEAREAATAIFRSWDFGDGQNKLVCCHEGLQDKAVRSANSGGWLPVFKPQLCYLGSG